MTETVPHDKTTSGGTVAKALDVLELISGMGRPVRFATVLSESVLPKATLYRLMQTLTQEGMLMFDAEANTYSPGPRLVRLAHSAWNQFSLAPIARPHLDALSETLGQTIHLAQLDGGQVLYVDKRNARTPVEMFAQAGKIGPGYCTGIGKAMLAFLGPEAKARALEQQAYHPHTPQTITDRATLAAELEEIVRTGVAYDREEHEPGIICIAVPILSGAGRVVGGISTTSTTHLHTLKTLADLLPPLKSTAAAISDAVSDWRFPEGANPSPRPEKPESCQVLL